MWHPLNVQCIVYNSASNSMAQAGHNNFKNDHMTGLLKGFADITIIDTTAGK